MKNGSISMDRCKLQRSACWQRISTVFYVSRFLLQGFEFHGQIIVIRKTIVMNEEKRFLVINKCILTKVWDIAKGLTRIT